jgi:CheY-like chemotaxis protein
MPVCDGFESTKRIRKLEKSRNKTSASPNSAFIIALTGQASRRDQELAFASGVDHFITKPMSLVQLRTLMEEWELTRKASLIQPV